MAADTAIDCVGATAIAEHMASGVLATDWPNVLNKRPVAELDIGIDIVVDIAADIAPDIAVDTAVDTAPGTVLVNKRANGPASDGPGYDEELAKGQQSA